jgi:hypothetical protein
LWVESADDRGDRRAGVHRPPASTSSAALHPSGLGTVFDGMSAEDTYAYGGYGYNYDPNKD